MINMCIRYLMRQYKCNAKNKHNNITQNNQRNIIFMLAHQP